MSFHYRLQLVAEDDPYPVYRWMRDHDPAHYSEPEQVWVLTRFADVAAAFKDWKTWSSERRGNLLNDIPERIGKTLGTTDPPAHRFARGLVDKAFTRGTVDRLMVRLTSLAKQLALEAHARGTFDLVSEVSAPYNAAILGAMFGVPDEDFLRIRHWLDDFFLREPSSEGEPPRQVIAMRHLRGYLDDLARRRMASSSDDLMTAMLAAEEDGRRLSQEQVVVTTMTFLTAGFESTNNLFTNLAHALALHPGLLVELKRDTSLIPAFVEEGMRWDAAAQGFVRSPVRAVELHGKTIPEGAQVLLHIGSANRDERQFEDADRFDIGRSRQVHLGMGQGIHYCVGAPLGRAMAQLIFAELVTAADCWEVDLKAAERVRTPNFRGFAKLPMCIAKRS
jgi:hypothetical protein